MKSLGLKSLRSKMIAIMMANVAVLGAVSIAVLSQLSRVHEELELNTVEANANTLADAIAAQFYERYGDVQAFAMNPDIKSSNRKTIVDALDAYAALYGIYDLIMVVDAKGKLVAVNSKSPEGKEIPSGQLYEKSFADEAWFKAAMAGEFTEDKSKNFVGTYVEDVQKDPWTSLVYGADRLGSGFSAAVKDASGKTIGVVTNRAGSRWFEVAFKEVQIGLKETGLALSEFQLLNKSGVVALDVGPKTLEKGEIPYDWGLLLKKNLVEAGDQAAVAVAKRKSGSVFEGAGDAGKIVGYGPVDGPKMVDRIGWSVVVRNSAKEAFVHLNRAKLIFYASFAIAMAAACLVALWFSGGISRKLLDLASSLSQGSNEISGGASSISDSSTRLSEAVTEQAAAIQETAASIDQVSAMAKKSADNAGQASKISQSSREAAERGQKAVQDVMTAIEEINRSNAEVTAQVEAGNRQIGEIVKVIADIEAKTKVINDIVFQTKLLSFNASVEAARAGEHGKGFAVVAEEVGNLAQMSGNAAKEISSMLESSIGKVEGIVRDTRSQVERLVSEGRSKLEHGTSVARACGEALENILSSVHQVDGMVEEISSASNEQAQGVGEVNKAMNQLDQVTQENSSIAQSASATAVELAAQSKKLETLVANLMTLVEGRERALSSAHASGEVPRTLSEEKPKARVLPMRAAKPSASAAAKPSDRPAAQPAAARAVGAAASPVPATPAANDPRFEDI